MKRKILNILVVILTISIIVEGFICFKNIKNNKVLEDIKTVDIFDNKDKTLSIMVQDPTTYEYKPDTSRTTWPSKTEYLYAGTKCTDASGNDVGDTTPYLKFDESDYTAIITTKKTIYCTLYFANGRPALEVLSARGGDYYAAGGGQHTTAVDGMYRFKGTASQVTNNYICLGASENPDVCKTDPENMYRIIGVTTDGKLKVIKAKKYGANQKWFSSYSDSRRWKDSLIFASLNGDFYNSLNARIQGLIENHTWNMDLVGSYPWTPTTTGNQDGTIQAHIGLMSGADYVNAYKDVSTDNWLFITHGWSGNTAEYEWTMSRYGYYSYSGSYGAWGVTTSGYLGTDNLNSTFAVRPIFYLLSTVGLIGEGTTTHPYTVTSIK